MECTVSCSRRRLCSTDPFCTPIEMSFRKISWPSSTSTVIVKILPWRIWSPLRFVLSSLVSISNTHWMANGSCAQSEVPPVWTKVIFYDVGQGGISSGTSHYDIRLVVCSFLYVSSVSFNSPALCLQKRVFATVRATLRPTQALANRTPENCAIRLVEYCFIAMERSTKSIVSIWNVVS